MKKTRLVALALFVLLRPIERHKLCRPEWKPGYKWNTEWHIEKCDW